MTISRRAARQGEAVKGSVKQAVGRFTRSRRTSAAGHRDGSQGHVRRAWATLKDPFGQ